MKLIFLFLGSCTVIATLLPIIQKDDWWIRIFDFPRVQIVCVAVFVLLVYIFFLRTNQILDYIFIIVVGAAILYQLYNIYPYTFLSSKQVLTSEKHHPLSRISLLISNVLMENRNVEKFKQIIKNYDPDIILAVETDDWWAENLNEFEKSHPYFLKYPLENTYGMLLYSKLELVESEVRFLVERDIPSIHALLRSRSGDLIQMHFVHPRPPGPAEDGDTEDGDTTERDAELLIVGKMAKIARKPVIIAGDLNDVAWSHTTRLFQKISRLLDPRIGRGFYNTFHAKYPLLRWPLDHVFHSDHFKLIKIERLDYFGSDHFPIYIQLSYEPEAKTQQEAPSVDQEDKTEAEETIDKAK